MGEGKNSSHRAITEEEQGITTVSLDYAFMTEEDRPTEEEKGTPVIIGIDRESKVLKANAVPSKGVNPYAVKITSTNLDNLGYKRLNLKTDQEPAIIA